MKSAILSLAFIKTTVFIGSITLGADHSVTLKPIPALNYLCPKIIIKMI